MKNIFERIKDFIYDSIDYMIVFAILVGVVLIIGWRIDLLFNTEDLSDNDPKDQIVVDIDHDSNDDNIDGDQATNNDQEDPSSNEDNDLGQITEEDNDNNNNNNNNDDTSDNSEKDNPSSLVNINIPPGSLPSKIASILEDKGLITNKDDFVTKSQELKLDTKLKSGTFDISPDNTLEEIIYIISK